MGKLRVAYIHGNEVGIEYVASEDIDVKNANIADNNKADNLEIPALNATNQYIEYYAGVSDEEGAGAGTQFLFGIHRFQEAFGLGGIQFRTRLLRKTT